MTNDIALDTNVLIYLHDSSDIGNRAIAKDLLADNPSICAQVVSEYLNVTRKLLSLSKETVLAQASDLFANCTIIPVLPGTLALASILVSKYNFQLFDSIIVAASLEAGCAILYSEDMHHGLVVEKRLTLTNPFR